MPLLSLFACAAPLALPAPAPKESTPQPKDRDRARSGNKEVRFNDEPHVLGRDERAAAGSTAPAGTGAALSGRKRGREGTPSEDGEGGGAEASARKQPRVKAETTPVGLSLILTH